MEGREFFRLFRKGGGAFLEKGPFCEIGQK